MAEPTPEQLRNRRIAWYPVMFTCINFLFHASGGVLFDIQSWALYPKLPYYELAELIRNTPRYTHLTASFIEFVLGIYVLIGASALLAVFLICGRAAFYLGFVARDQLEKPLIVVGLLVAFWAALTPYVLPMTSGNENDKFLILSLRLHMLWQSVTWLIILCGFLAFTLSPKLANAGVTRRDRSSTI